jgi:hypothetical protein
MLRSAWITAIAVMGAALTARAQTPMVGTAEDGPPRANFPTATLGGQQFWSDELVLRDCRIQQNALTGHYRLLDENDFRRAWGTYDHCRKALDDIQRHEMLPPVEGRVLVALHGLFRSRDQMEDIGEYLAEEADYTLINVGYASTRRSLDDHAHSLARVVDNLKGATEIDFVCHSLGNLVVRRYLGEASQPEPRWHPDRRIKRMVMLGPPNKGARFAQLFKGNKLYAVIAGPSGKQLAESWEDDQKLLAVPPIEFGILAGGLGSAAHTNPLVPGDDDWLVSVEETRLPGARDFRVVPCLHGELMDDDRVRQCALSFLKHGYFTAEDARQPIEARRTEKSTPRTSLRAAP